MDLTFEEYEEFRNHLLIPMYDYAIDMMFVMEMPDPSTVDAMTVVE